MKTAIYARVSTEDQAEKYGIVLQLRACRDYAKAHGLKIVAEITDDGISGAILDRPGLNRVRDMVSAGQVEAVLMYDADRLSRELAHLLILKPEIERRAKLLFVAANFEDSPSGRMFFGIRGVIAQYEREQTRERTMRGKKERARSGLIVGGRVAYGYRYDAGRLVPNERAATVRRIFESYDQGHSIRGIVRDLRADGVPTWAGRRWGNSSVRRILGNETYAGVTYYGTHRREGKLLKLRTDGERITLPAPSIVSRALFDRVQVRLSENPNTGRPSPQFLLRGLLYCHCGKRMHGDGGHSNAYRCRGREDHTCREHASAPKVDAAIWDALRLTFTDPDALRAALRKHEASLRQTAPAKVDDLRKRVTRLKRKEDTILAALLDPDLAAGRAEIKEQYRAVCGERRKAESELSQIQMQERPSKGEWLDDAAAQIREAIEGLDQAEKQEFVRLVVNRADFSNGEIRMRCFIGPELSRSSTRCERFPLIVIARVAA